MHSHFLMRYMKLVKEANNASLFANVFQYNFHFLDSNCQKYLETTFFLCIALELCNAIFPANATLQISF